MPRPRSPRSLRVEDVRRLLESADATFDAPPAWIAASSRRTASRTSFVTPVGFAGPTARTV